MPTTILGDWGTTRLRLWRRENGVVQDRREGPGIGALAKAPATTLSEAIAPWLERGPVQRIVLCGMAGARGALHELGYVECPTDPDKWRSGAAGLDFQGIPLRIAAGVACRNAAGAADVMRGEETQLFGAIALRPELGQGRHRLVLPGTHSKWIELADGWITGFRTFPTGELFGLLLKSTLVAPGAAEQAEDEATGFGDGIAQAQTGGGLLGSLFAARAGQLRDGRSPSWARGYLSGLVIGSEVMEMRRDNWPPDEVTIIGDQQLTARYELALGAFGMATQRADGDACVLAGLDLLDADN